jgi:hypothetical protein
MNARLILVGLGVVGVLGCVDRMNGQGWAGGYPYAPYWGYGCPTIYSTESVPYYCLHPPVYYSYRVARTYGYSPFAYPPGVLTPGSEPPHPAMVQNVYAAEAEQPSESQEGRPPQRIENPFVEQPGRPGVTKSQRPVSRQPQVVYPTALARRGS